MDIVSWVGAVLAIGLLIIVHEAGHYLVAKWCRMRVDRFSLGFGPALVGWRRKDTLFQIAPIPFGGFVEIRGMNIAEEVDPDDPYAYPNRPVWQRFAAIFAGPATNYVFAIFLAFVLYITAGMSSGTAWYRVSTVAQGFDAHGKLEPGDRIVSIQRAADTAPIEVYHRHRGEPPSQPLASLVHESEGKPMTVTVHRDPDGKLLTFQISAQQDPDIVWDEDTGEKQYRLGIGLEFQEERVSVGLWRAAGYAIYYPVEQTRFILGMLYKIIVGEEKGELTGPVGIASTIKQAIEVGWLVALQLLMMLNVWLGLVNLLPLPALDGGRLVFLVYEMATRRRANPKIESTVHMAGIMILLLVMVLVTFNDCARVL